MLEQAHDTKELSRVQRRLAARGKLVGKFVNGSVTVRSTGVESGSCFLDGVDKTSSLHTRLPGYRQVFPHIQGAHIE
jgi:hypothetical protein